MNESSNLHTAHGHISVWQISVWNQTTFTGDSLTHVHLIRCLSAAGVGRRNLSSMFFILVKGLNVDYSYIEWQVREQNEPCREVSVCPKSVVIIGLVVYKGE